MALTTGLYCSLCLSTIPQTSVDLHCFQIKPEFLAFVVSGLDPSPPLQSELPDVDLEVSVQPG